MASWKEPETNHTAGDQVTPEIFNTLAENEVYLNETKITTNQVQEATVMSETSATRENLTEQDTVMGAFGKIRKWFADLRALAFKDTVATADINNSAVTSDKIASSAVTSTKLGTSSVITSKINALAVTTEKLANLAVTAAKLAANAVTLIPNTMVEASRAARIFFLVFIMFCSPFPGFCPLIYFLLIKSLFSSCAALRSAEKFRSFPYPFSTPSAPVFI